MVKVQKRRFMKSLLTIILIILGVYLVIVAGFLVLNLALVGVPERNLTTVFQAIVSFLFFGIIFYLIKKKRNSLEDDFISLFFKVHILRAKDSIDKSKERLKSELDNRDIKK